MDRRSPLFTAFIYAMALLLAVVILAPMLWLFVMSISSAADLSARPLHWWPAHPDFSRYGKLLSLATNSTGAAFLSALWNSLRVATMATVAAIAIAVPAAWASSRVPQVGWSLALVVASYMLPPVALSVPLYMGLAHFGMLNSVYG
ncbi:carbohydrate ABC transporter permease, partial [Thioclava sp. BHET1]